jgi:uncharacterized damage-inducible protein DinB
MNTRSMLEVMNDYFQTISQLIEYELWCNLQAMQFLEKLNPQELERDFGFGLRTPHQTMFHIANVMRTWSLQVKPQLERVEPLVYNKNSSLQDIRLLFEEVGQAWLLAAQASHDLGVLERDRRLHQVFHLVTHGTHHRGQLLSMATILGHDQPFEGGDFGGWSNTIR